MCLSSLDAAVAEKRIKKPTWRNTLRCSATSVYFLTSLLANQVASNQSSESTARKSVYSIFPTPVFYGVRLAKQGRAAVVVQFRRFRAGANLLGVLTRCDFWNPAPGLPEGQAAQE